MIEIERKFLVKNTTFIKLAIQQTRIIQGFLNTNPNRTVRVRITGSKGFLAVKGISDTSGVSRFEWEKEISLSDAESLLPLCEPGIISKIRYNIPANNHIYEVDVFFDDNDGLIVAEIELSNATESFIKPDWLGREVTGDTKYYNSSLSKNPFKLW